MGRFATRVLLFLSLLCLPWLAGAQQRAQRGEIKQRLAGEQQDVIGFSHQPVRRRAFSAQRFGPPPLFRLNGLDETVQPLRRKPSTDRPD